MTSAQPSPSSSLTIDSLQQRFADRVLTSASIREHYGKDESYHSGFPPDAVIRPQTTAEVAEIVSLCAANKTPIIPYGVGTSLEGQVAALHGGVTLDLGEMNRIIRVNHDDLDCVIQPGVTRRQLNDYLHDSGLFFPVDPGADATLGGMTATRASGTNAVRYGTMRENVLALTVVLPNGKVIKTSKRARKSAAGYDLTHLYIGSEGTLGVITEITLRLYGIPESISAAVCSFPSLNNAVRTVIETIQYGIPVARIELLDEVQLGAINQYSKTDFPVAPTLFLEFHGSESAVSEQAQLVKTIAGEYGGGDFQWAVKPEDRHKLWRARHDAAYAAKALRPNGQIWATDVCVPISKLADCIEATQKDIAGSGLLAPIVGHVGDGNFHLVLLVNHDDADEVKRAENLHRRMVERALSMDGTCTGEHGIGYGKLDFLRAEHGEAVDVMHAIKQAIDPDNIMNPGKIFS